MELMLISKRVFSINEVVHSITESCSLLIATVSLSSWVWQAYLRWNGEFLIFIGSLRSPSFPMSTAKMHQSWISFGELFLLKPNSQKKSQGFILASYLVDNLLTWNAYLPRCTCKFFRLLIKDGYTYMCRILQCLYMKRNGDSRVYRWRTHR